MTNAQKLDVVSDLIKWGCITWEDVDMLIDYGAIYDTIKRRYEIKVEEEKASWNPDKQCMKCGDELHWVRAALVCKTHGYTGKGC